MGRRAVYHLLGDQPGAPEEVTRDEARALLIVAALWTGATNSASFVGGRASSPVPQVRYVTVPEPTLPEAVTPEPPPAAPTVEPVTTPEAPAVETKPPPKVEVKPKPKPQAKPRVQKKSLPSCAFIKSEYERMSWAERMAEYRKSTVEEIAHGKRCLGM